MGVLVSSLSLAVTVLHSIYIVLAITTTETLYTTVVPVSTIFGTIDAQCKGYLPFCADVNWNITADCDPTLDIPCDLFVLRSNSGDIIIDLGNNAIEALNDQGVLVQFDNSELRLYGAPSRIIADLSRAVLLGSYVSGSSGSMIPIRSGNLSSIDSTLFSQTFGLRDGSLSLNHNNKEYPFYVFRAELVARKNIQKIKRQNEGIVDRGIFVRSGADTEDPGDIGPFQRVEFTAVPVSQDQVASASSAYFSQAASRASAAAASTTAGEKTAVESDTTIFTVTNGPVPQTTGSTATSTIGTGSSQTSRVQTSSGSFVESPTSTVTGTTIGSLIGSTLTSSAASSDSFVSRSDSSISSTSSEGSSSTSSSTESSSSTDSSSTDTSSTDTSTTDTSTTDTSTTETSSTESSSSTDTLTTDTSTTGTSSTDTSTTETSSTETYSSETSSTEVDTSSTETSSTDTSSTETSTEDTSSSTETSSSITFFTSSSSSSSSTSSTCTPKTRGAIPATAANYRCGRYLPLLPGVVAGCDPNHWSCCSSSNYCGNTTAYCGTGCQPSYGCCNGVDPLGCPCP